MNKCPSRITGAFLQLCREVHAWLVAEGEVADTPEGECRVMELLAEKCKDFIMHDEDGSRFYLVTGIDAPTLQ